MGFLKWNLYKNMALFMRILWEKYGRTFKIFFGVVWKGTPKKNTGSKRHHNVHTIQQKNKVSSC